MQAISVKELRENLPAIRGQLKKGESFLIIHKSKPIATLEPVNGLPSPYGGEETLDDFQKQQSLDWSRMYTPLTKEEHDYYMSLAPKK